MNSLRPAFARVLLLFGLAAASLWLVGRFRYTSIGLDRNERVGERGRVTYYRVRWPGDGSVWIGRSAQLVPLEHLSRYALEPGGRLFASPHVPEPRSRWNRLGFWRVAEVDEDPLLVLLYPDPCVSTWLAVPGWLPALVTLAGYLWLRPRRRDPRRAELWRSGR